MEGKSPSWHFLQTSSLRFPPLTPFTYSDLNNMWDSKTTHVCMYETEQRGAQVPRALIKKRSRGRPVGKPVMQPETEEMLKSFHLK